MRLTPKQLFCLYQIKDGPKSTWQICRLAEASKDFARVTCRFEWADAPIRELRKLGLIEKTGEKDNERPIYRITDLGRTNAPQL
jgi:DNA-binding HxlR family transcriptional regulator